MKRKPPFPFFELWDFVPIKESIRPVAIDPIFSEYCYSKMRILNFSVKTIIKDPHFGIAIFRKDGVYCYGPNTLFDGHKIPELKKGKGWFSLHYKKLWLAPGEYVLSVAIW